MDIMKRENSPYWHYWFRVKGKLYRGTTGIRLGYPEEARRVLARKYEEVMQHRVVGEKPPILIADAFDRAMTTGKDKSASTLTQYRSARDKLLGQGPWTDRGRWKLPKHVRYLHEVEDEHVEDLIAARKNEGLTNNSINGELRPLIRAVNVCAKRFRVNRELEVGLLEKFEKTRWLSDFEVQAVEARLQSKAERDAHDRAKTLFTVLLGTGVRLNEAIELEWTDINFSLNRIELYRGKTESLSVVPLSDSVTAALKRRSNQPRPFMSMDRPIKILRGVISETCNTSDKIVRQRGKATVHTLRDTYASRLVQSGMSLLAVSKLLGHSSITMTRKYAHLEVNQTAEEARAILNAAA